MASPVFQFKTIPVPIFSDGNQDVLNLAQRRGFQESPDLIAPFFQSVGFKLKELCLKHPSEFNLPPNINVSNFEPVALFNQLPRNYKLFQDPANNLVIFGHPSRMPFQSATDMLPHLIWLGTPNRFNVQCECRLCNTRYASPIQSDPSPASFGIQRQESQFEGEYRPNQPQIQQRPYPHQQLPQMFPQSHGIPFQNGQQEFFNYQTTNPGNGQFPGTLPSPNLNLLPNQLPHQPALDISQRITTPGKPNAIIPSSSASTPKASSKTNTSLMVKINAGATPKDVPSTEDIKFKGKFLAAKNEVEQMEKELEKLQDLIDTANASVARLKFEKRLLLGAITAKDDLKHFLDDTTSEDSAESYEHESASDLDTEDFGEDPEFEQPKQRQTRKKRIKLLDPNAPKRPANAFIMFCELSRISIKEERRRIARKAPGSDNDVQLLNLTKALGARWRQLEEEDRKVYQDMFKEQVKQYDQDLKEYMALYPNAPLEDAQLNTLPNNWSDPNAPKRSANAFFVFCEMEDERLKKNRKLERSEKEEEEELALISKSYGERWRKLSDSDRKGILLLIVYVEKYEEEVRIFREYMDQKRQSLDVSME